MSKNELDKDRAVCEAATPGPWEMLGSMFSRQRGVGQAWETGKVVAADVAKSRDATFIARARTRYPELVEEVTRLRAENEKLQRTNKALWFVVGVAKRFVDLWNEEEDRPKLPICLNYAGSKLGYVLDAIHGKPYECPLDCSEKTPCDGCRASQEEE